MKRIVCAFAFSFLLLFAASAFASPIACPTSGSGPGGTPSYADLMSTNAGGGCLIADKVFSDFIFLSISTGGATPLTSNQVNYTMDNLVPSVLGTVLVGFEFGLSLSAGPLQTNTVTIGYNVAQINGIADITSVHNQMVGVGLNGGVASVAESYCLGAFNNVGCQAGTPQTLVTSNPGSSHSDAFFAGVNKLSILANLSASGFDGTANISGVRSAIDETPTSVPEPSSLSCLLGSAGLFGVVWLRRRSSAAPIRRS